MKNTSILNILGDQRRATVNEVFARFFESLGYGVTFEGRLNTGERWHEIYDEEGIIVQVAFGAPLEEFLTDLPHLAEGKSGVGPTEYWCACEDDDKLRDLHARVTSVQVRKLRSREMAECSASLVGRDVTLVHQVYSARHSAVFEVGEVAIVQAASDKTVHLIMTEGRVCLLDRGMFETVP